VNADPLHVTIFLYIPTNFHCEQSSNKEERELPNHRFPRIQQFPRRTRLLATMFFHLSPPSYRTLTPPRPHPWTTPQPHPLLQQTSCHLRGAASAGPSQRHYSPGSYSCDISSPMHSRVSGSNLGLSLGEVARSFWNGARRLLEGLLEEFLGGQLLPLRRSDG
jgi:hypothetical protein